MTLPVVLLFCVLSSLITLYICSILNKSKTANLVLENASLQLDLKNANRQLKMFKESKPNVLIQDLTKINAELRNSIRNLEIKEKNSKKAAPRGALRESW